MTYTESNKRAIKKWREKNLEYTREKARESMAKFRAKWYLYIIESKRLMSINY